MSEAVLRPTAPLAFVLREKFVEAYQWMLLARRFEEKVASLYHAGKIVGGVYIGRGQEAFSAALGLTLQRGRDVFGPLIRDMAGRLAFGANLLDPARTYLGSVFGPMRGRDGNVHWGHPTKGMPVMISHLGSLISVVSGMLLARRFRGQNDIVGATTIGDGATSTGSFHEALNLAAIERLPLVVAVANNQFAYSTPVSRQFACKELADRAIGYGIEAQSIDGTDLEACLRAFDRAVTRARQGRGPQMVVGDFLRLSGHGEHDDSSYIPESLRKSPLGRDCLEVARGRIIDETWATPAELQRWEEAAAEQVQVALATAQKEPGPDPFQEKWRAISSHWLVEPSE